MPDNQIENIREEINYPSIDRLVKMRPMYFAHDIKNRRIDFVLWAHASVSRFTSNKPPISYLSKKIPIIDAEYDQLLENFGAQVQAADSGMIDIFGIDPQKNVLDWYEVDGENRVIQILATPLAGSRDIRRDKRTDLGDAFNKTMQENRAILEQIFGVCVQYAAGLRDLPYGELLQD